MAPQKSAHPKRAAIGCRAGRVGDGRNARRRGRGKTPCNEGILGAGGWAIRGQVLLRLLGIRKLAHFD